MRGEISLIAEALALATVVMIVATRVLLPHERRGELRLPLIVLVLHLIVATTRALVHFAPPIQRLLGPAAVFFLLVAFGQAAFLLFIDVLLRHRAKTPLPKIFRDVLQAIVITVAIFLALRSAGVDPGSLLATSALLTAVVGLSLQETLGNLFGGLALQVQRPFEAGDWIQFDGEARNVGRVIEIGWRATRVFTNDEIELVIPNSTLAKSVIRNFTKPTARSRRSVYVQAPYEVPPGDVHQTIVRALLGVEGVAADPAPTVVTEEFAESGVTYWVRYFTDDFARREIVDGEVRDRIWYAFQRARISIPFPIRTVHMSQVSEQDLAEKAAARGVAKAKEGLRSVAFFAALPEDAIAKLAEHCDVRRYITGERVITQGERGEELFAIEDGEVSVHITSNGRDIEVGRLHAGEFFGEMSLMTGERRTATVVATTPASLLVVSRDAMKGVLESWPDLTERIGAVLAERQVELGERSFTELDAKQSVEEKSGALIARIRAFFQL